MKLDNKGFAISTVMYLILLMSIILISVTLAVLSSRKLVLDKIKEEVMNDIMKIQLCTLSNDSTITGKSIGAKYICDLGETASAQDLIFYVIESIGPKTYLIQSENYDQETLNWCDLSGPYPSNNKCDMDGLTSKLNEIKTSWSKLNSAQIIIPTVSQIANVDKIDYNTNSALTSNWLYDNLDSPLNGYWTSTADSSKTANAFFVSSSGNLVSANVYRGSSFGYGIRPVIIIYNL